MIGQFLKIIGALMLALMLFGVTLGSPAHAGTAAVHQGEAIDEARGRTIPYLIWGPSDGTGEAAPVAGNSVFEPVMAVPNGTFAEGPHPLVVLFHGTSGNYRAMGWIGSRLAAEGYMVIAANHPGSTSLQVTLQSMMQTWSQAEDGSFLIGHLLTSETYGPLIDGDRIIAAGFSLGGYSALAIGGAVIRMDPFQDFCRERPSSETCILFGEELYGPLAEARDQERYLGDPRIRAVVSLAPGLVPFMDPESLRAIDVPALVIAGSQDEMLPVERHARGLLGAIPQGTYVELSNASHFSFLGICTPEAPELLVEEDATFLCDNPEGGDRGEMHDLTTALIVTFLKAHELAGQ